MPTINLTKDEIERLKSILGTMVARGVNPNAHGDYRIVTSREDLEMILRIFNGLSEDVKE